MVMIFIFCKSTMLFFVGAVAAAAAAYFVQQLVSSWEMGVLAFVFVKNHRQTTYIHMDALWCFFSVNLLVFLLLLLLVCY